MNFPIVVAAIQLFTKKGDRSNGMDDVLQFNFLRDALLLNISSAGGGEDWPFFNTLAPSLCWSLHWKLITMKPLLRGSPSTTLPLR